MSLIFLLHIRVFYSVCLAGTLFTNYPSMTISFQITIELIKLGTVRLFQMTEPVLSGNPPLVPNV